jgi:hypothetical protein
VARDERVSVRAGGPGQEQLFEALWHVLSAHDRDGSRRGGTAALLLRSPSSTGTETQKEKELWGGAARRTVERGPSVLDPEQNRVKCNSRPAHREVTRGGSSIRTEETD